MKHELGNLSEKENLTHKCTTGLKLKVCLSSGLVNTSLGV